MRKYQYLIIWYDCWDEAQREVLNSESPDEIGLRIYQLLEDEKIKRFKIIKQELN